MLDYRDLCYVHSPPSHGNNLVHLNQRLLQMINFVLKMKVETGIQF